ncbi:MAG: sigma 54-interacting transcriptional regulator [Peptococcaceae bacterium]|nr:sigma 54-interacting transcriptional regulator [Peptococcaceae bacterium]
MSKVQVAIIGAGNGGSSVYRTLQSIDNIAIAGMADINPNAPGLILARSAGIFTTDSIAEICKLPELKIIIEATGLSEVQAEIRRLKRTETSLMEAEVANIVMSVIEEKERLVEIKRLKGELDAVFDSVQEAIEVADREGTITYVNPAFTRVTGILARERVGQNVLQVSPNGALAKTLRTHQAVFGHRSEVGGSTAEVVSNSAPIVVEGKMEGGVVVFQPLNDIFKLWEQLQQSTSIIAGLNDRIGQISASNYTFDDIIGSQPEFARVVNLARKAALSDSSVLILGESGTGKEVFANALHAASKRSALPFIKVSCASIPPTLLESELFGQEKIEGSTLKAKLGKLELAEGGTIFLDEIGDINLHTQAKLLRVLQDREFERIGSSELRQVNVRVVATSNRNLKEMVQRGEFRQDLYYRINVVELRLPPLRQHPDDIPAYVQHLVAGLNRKLGKKIKGVTTEGEELLKTYHWPGNVRELQNVLERAMITAEDDVITYAHLLALIEQPKQVSGLQVGDIMPLSQMENILIKQALARYGDSVEGKKKAAQMLNISLATLYNKIKSSS